MLKYTIGNGPYSEGCRALLEVGRWALGGARSMALVLLLTHEGRQMADK